MPPAVHRCLVDRRSLTAGHRLLLAAGDHPKALQPPSPVRSFKRAVSSSYIAAGPCNTTGCSPAPPAAGHHARRRLEKPPSNATGCHLPLLLHSKTTCKLLDAVHRLQPSTALCPSSSIHHHAALTSSPPVAVEEATCCPPFTADPTPPAAIMPSPLLSRTIILFLLEQEFYKQEEPGLIKIGTMAIGVGVGLFVFIEEDLFSCLYKGAAEAIEGGRKLTGRRAAGYHR